MNFFILILLIPLAFAETAPGCNDLALMVEGYEKDLMKKGISPEICKDLDLNKMDQEAKAKAQAEAKASPTSSEPIYTEEDISFFNEYKCSNFAVIENKISDLENELTLLEGFDKLKNDINEQKQKTANKDEEIAKEGGRNFVDALATAQTLDTLLTAQDENGEILLKRLLQVPLADRQDPEKLKIAFTQLCKGNKGGSCNLNLSPSQSTVDDINKLLEQPLSEETLETWRSAIAIKQKDGKQYSFSEMAKELKEAFTKLGNKDSSISRKELLAIQALPDFENVKGLEFLQDLKEHKGAENFITASQFKFLVEDLTNRQAFEMTSKISYLYAEHKDQMDESQRASCKSAAHSLSTALSCMEILKDYSKQKGQVGNPLSTLARVLKGLDVSKNYYSNLNEISQNCISANWMEDPTSNMREGCLNKINGDIAKLPKKISALYLLKEKIGSESQRQMNFRNLAVNKWAQCSENGKNSNIGECDTAFAGYISKEAISLSSDVANLSVVYKPNEDHLITAKAECSKDQKLTRQEERLCAFFNDTTSNVLEGDIVKKNPDEYQAPTDAPDGGHNPQREAWVQGLANITREMVNQYQSNQNRYRPTINPYMYNYSPYNGGRPLMGISDSILFNARYYGAYGYYMPTMGFQPFTAFGKRPTTAYTPYASSTSAYFTTK